jgi:hypothetical protein
MSVFGADELDHVVKLFIKEMDTFENQLKLFDIDMVM